MQNVVNEQPSAVDAISARVTSTTIYSVAVIDTGVDYLHPDLAGHVILGPDFGDHDADPMDVTGHGTFTAGLLVSQNSSAPGVVPDANVIALKVTHGNTLDADLTAIRDALQWVLDNRERYHIAAINISLGMGNVPKGATEPMLEPLYGQLAEAGVFIVAAAGNAYGPSAPEGLSRLASSPNVTAVGAVWSSDVGPKSFSTGAADTATGVDRIASFSQRDRGLDLLAPGGDVTNLRLPDGLMVRSGTSMAAPLVAGAALLVRQAADAKGITLTTAEMRDLLRRTGTPVFDGDDEQDNVPNSYRYYSRLDVAAALRAVLGTSIPSVPPVVPPAPPVPTEPILVVVIPVENAANVPSNHTGSTAQDLPVGGSGAIWDLRGGAAVTGGTVTLIEHSRVLTGASTTLSIPASAGTLTFTLTSIDLASNGEDQPPDAFEAALLNAGSLTPLIGSDPALANSDAFLNIQPDGTVYAGPGVTLAGTMLPGGKFDLSAPIVVTVDLSSLSPDVLATLSFDLIGFGTVASSVVLEVPVGVEEQLSSLAGTVYRDDDFSGTFTGTDSGLGGITVALTGTDDLGAAVSRTTTTLSDGTYSFGSLRVGTYTIAETQPGLPTPTTVGYFDGADTLGTLGGTRPAKNQLRVVLSAGQSGTGYTFGELPAAPGANGFVYVDADNDGHRDANEVGIGNVAITLSGTAFAGTPFTRPLTASDVFGGSLTVQTSTNGAWSFGPLPAGTYSIAEQQPAGFTDGGEENGYAVKTITVGNDSFGNVNLTTSAIVGPLNFGERDVQPEGTTVVSGAVFHDRDRDGTFDANEFGLAGVTVELRPSGDGATRTATTDANGNFSFGAVRPGGYTLVQIQPVGYGSSTANTFAVTVPDSLAPVTGQNFGETLGTITGSVYRDTNGDGIRSVFDPGIGGVPIALSGTDARGTAVTLSTTTAADGSFAFTDLLSGTYTLTETQPAGFRDGLERTGDAVGVTVGNDSFSTIALGAGTTRGSFDFTELPVIAPTRIRDVVGMTVGQDPFLLRSSEINSQLNPFRGFDGFVSIAVGDLTGDGVEDIVFGAWAGGGPRVVAVDGATGATLANFFAYDSSFRGGVTLAVGDVDRDGVPDIITGAGPGGAPHVKAFDSHGRELLSFFADDFSQRAGISVAVGDVTGDGVAEIITGAGVDARIRAFDVTNFRVVFGFRAFDVNFTGGVYVAAADVDGDGRSEIVAGPGLGGGPRVDVIDTATGRTRDSFFAYESWYRGGVRVAAFDMDSDGFDEIATGSGWGGGPRLRVMDGRTFESIVDRLVGDERRRDGMFVG